MYFKNNTATLGLIVLLGAMNMYSTCKGRLGCTENLYSFSIGIKGYPDRDSIKVGDTLWLEVNAPTQLMDAQTGRLTDYSGAANLGSALAFQGLTPATNTFTTEAAQKFNIAIVYGMEIINRTPTLYREYNFAEVNANYLFKIGVVPKEKGVFRVIFSNATGVYRKNDKCSKASFTLNFKDTNRHYYLNPNFPGGPTPVGGDYYFDVN